MLFFFFRRNGETVVIAKNKWSHWYESSVLKELIAQFSAVTAKSAKIHCLTSTSSGRNQSKFLLRSTNSLVVFNRFREHGTILMMKLKENMKYRFLFNHFNRGRVCDFIYTLLASKHSEYFSDFISREID